MPVHLVSCIDVKDFGAETVRVGDLNGDGAPDLLLVQSEYGRRSITCLTAVTIDGRVLWQVGVPDPRNGCIYSDLPVQIYDFDGDGRNEVLYIKQATYAELHPGTGFVAERALRYEGHASMVVLDAQTGQLKRTIPLPAPADDSFLFADLTGRGRRMDLVVKDRYWNMWGVTHDGRVLWHWEGSVGHYPAIADVDGDGCDEVFVGVALIDHDGRVLFQKDAAGTHQDAAYITAMPDGSWRLLYGNGGLHCLAPDGRELWRRPMEETQHVLAGRFRRDSPVQFMAVNRGDRSRAESPATVYLYDADGHELWRRPQPKGSWCTSATKIDWLGGGSPDCALLFGRATILINHDPAPGEPIYCRQPGTPDAIIDGDGNVVDEFDLQLTPDRSEKDRARCVYGTAADVWGDGQQEVILSGSRGLSIYANARPLQLPTLYNETLYPGM